ncbi:hypothetical protein FRC98_14675 [Lujinxingia vulgaris]|uniref:Outer membrane protein beta-barrel domain-containing protein n=1 Tax=Lujinxingia vulgaris TaxID=2600176 RepID=A0A5C6X260_9DELT|nr:hypothetical protein [Lujinxingia vulgaris]TXD35912.1 hypothetical protein FRC98_14675 [Lujinxingia vulgaris]
MSQRHVVAAVVLMATMLTGATTLAEEGARATLDLNAPSVEVEETLREDAVASEERSTRLFGVGVFTRGGMAAYRAVACGCFDRKTWRAGLGARVHVGPYLAAEVGVQYGMMMLGGNFPLNGWELAARWQPAPHATARAVAGLYTRLGFSSMQVMGMRSVGAPGVSAALGWSLELVPMLSLEVEAGAQRHFGAMAHWQLGGQLGLATRF